MKGKITISKPVRGDGLKFIELRVRDGASRNTFIEVKMTLENFAEVLMGLSEVDCDFELRNPEVVGKKKEIEKLEIELPKGMYADKRFATKEAIRLMPEGWELWDTFSSQGSFFTRDGVNMAKCNIVRYVEVVDDES